MACWAKPSEKAGGDSRTQAWQLPILCRDKKAKRMPYNYRFGVYISLDVSSVSLLRKQLTVIVTAGDMILPTRSGGHTDVHTYRYKQYIICICSSRNENPYADRVIVKFGLGDKEDECSAFDCHFYTLNFWTHALGIIASNAHALLVGLRYQWAWNVVLCGQ